MSMDFLKNIKRPPFTPAGAAVLFIAVVMLIFSLLNRNPYEIILTMAVLLLLLVLGITGAWKSRKLKSMEAGWKPPFPMTSGSGEETLVSGLEEKIPVFFRLHYIVRGRFSSAGCYVSAETSVPRGESTARLLIDFPMSGVFHGDGMCRLKDVFGFFSFSCGITQSKTVNVRSSPHYGKNYLVNAQSGAEDKRNKTSSDEERYYMREYSPGDRLRDINWKSSEKIDALITRISPDNQEKVSRIEIYLRNYGPVNKPSVEALWLLDRSKAGLSRFLRSLMETQSSFIFDVRSADGSWEIEDEEDLDNFLEDLAGIQYSPSRYENAFLPNAGELYIFSTARDAGLSSFILACHPRPVSLFLVQPARRKSKGETAPDMKTETLWKRDFPLNSCFPLNARWLNREKIKQLGVNTGKMETIYAETRL